MIIAFLLALFAGLATSVGGLLALNKRVLQREWLAVALAFAAGAMILVSFVEMIPLGIDSLKDNFGGPMASWLVYSAFFVGALIVALIDRVLPRSFNPSMIEGRESELSQEEKGVNKKLLRSGAVVAVVLALHNFPEGISTFFASYQDISAGVALAIAIAVHNIPEGIAVAAPIYAATKSRKKAFWWATASGVAEPIGALVAVGLINFFFPQEVLGIIFGLIAGMMVFIAVDELLPAAHRYMTRKHQVVYGTMSGMGVVALSLLIIV